eukprot:118837-Chlamydomonas_euryale.AAC.5
MGRRCCRLGCHFERAETPTCVVHTPHPFALGAAQGALVHMPPGSHNRGASASVAATSLLYTLHDARPRPLLRRVHPSRAVVAARPNEPGCARAQWCACELQLGWLGWAGHGEILEKKGKKEPGEGDGQHASNNARPRASRRAGALAAAPFARVIASRRRPVRRAAPRRAAGYPPFRLGSESAACAC